MRYLIVIHCWFVDSLSWGVIESKATSMKEAIDEAKILNYEKLNTFRHSAFRVIEIASNERPNKLSWKERISGRLR